MLGNVIKKIVPTRIKAYLKMGKEKKLFRNVIENIEHDSGNYDLLIGTAIHTNLGDHLIVIAEQEMMHELNPKRKVYEIPTEVFLFYRRRLRRSVKLSSRIFINGGGWMGNLWLTEERVLQSVVGTFVNNKIVIFPQTIFYDKNVKPYQDLIDSGNMIYRKCKDLTIFVRDKQSYEFAVNNLEIKRIELVPDIALYYKRKTTNPTKERIVGICIRDDRERYSDRELIEQICDSLSNQGYQIMKISTMNNMRVPSTERLSVCEQRLTEFSKCKVILTDRLHGMIFSYLSGTPCVAFDNKTRKVSGVYNEWLKGCKSIYPAFDRNEANSILQFINTEGMSSVEGVDLAIPFLPVIEEVRYGRD